MVLERSVLLLQQEKGIHQEIHNGNKKHWVKYGNKTEGRHTEVTVLWVGYSVTFTLGQGNAETWSSQKREALIQHGTQETQEQQG